MTSLAAVARANIPSARSDLARRAYVADAVVHALSVGFAIAAAGRLASQALQQPDLERALALLVYGLALVVTLSLSAAYNLNRDPDLTERLRCCDHAGIFALIGGTYTPLAVMVLDRQSGALVLSGIWSAALIGAVIKLKYPRRFERLGIAAYLVLGWMILPLLGPLADSMPAPALWLLGAGCVIYTIGVGFHLARRLPYNTVIWHVLVLLGAACHAAMISGFVAVPA
jgi:hemolysin III